MKRFNGDIAQSHHRYSRPAGRPRRRRQARLRRPPWSCSTPPWWRAWTCAAAGRARARPPCSIRRRPWKASTPSCCPAARPSGSMPPPACRPGCANRAAASASAMPWCRSCRARSCSTCSTAATRTGAAIRPTASSATRRRKAPAPTSRSAAPAPGSAPPPRPQRRRRLGLGEDARRHHRRRAGGGQCRRPHRHRRRSAFLGGAVRAEQGIRRARLAGAGSRRPTSRSAPKAGRARTPQSPSSRPTPN